MPLRKNSNGSSQGSSDSEAGSTGSDSITGEEETNNDEAGSSSNGERSTIHSISSQDGKNDGENNDSTSNSSSSSSGAGFGNALKDRFNSLFKKKDKSPLDETPSDEDLSPLIDRVDNKLLAEVEEYNAAPTEAADYGKAMFWDERYSSNTEAFEWYHPWATLAPFLTQYMDEDDMILVCGCGNSEMSVDMYDDGFENIVNVDISRVVILQMEDLYEEYNMTWKAMNLKQTNFPDEKFDVALDKGCLDAILCGMDGTQKAKDYLQELDRVLQPEGAYICISYAPPEERLELLEYWDLDSPNECLSWDVHVDAIAKPPASPYEFANPRDMDVYYIYVCIKDPKKVMQRVFAKEKSKREQEKKLAKMTGVRQRRGARGRGKGRP